MSCHTYGYPPSLCQYESILLGNRHVCVCVWITGPGCTQKFSTQESKHNLVITGQCPTHYATHSLLNLLLYDQHLPDLGQLCNFPNLGNNNLYKISPSSCTQSLDSGAKSQSFRACRRHQCLQENCSRNAVYKHQVSDHGTLAHLHSDQAQLQSKIKISSDENTWSNTNLSVQIMSAAAVSNNLVLNYRLIQPWQITVIANTS